MDATDYLYGAFVIYVVLVSNLAVLREGMKRILLQCDDIGVIAELDNVDDLNGGELIQGRSLVVVMTHPGQGGYTFLSRLNGREHPLRVIHIVRSPSLSEVLGLLRNGAHGVLDASCAANHLATAIRAVSTGRIYLHEEVARLVAGNLTELGKDRSHTSLTQRELEIFAKLASGQRVTEIADQLGISVKTVSTHKTRLMEKMNMATQSQLVQYAIAHGLFRQ